MITLKVITRFNKPILIRYKNLDHLKTDLKNLYKFVNEITERRYELNLKEIKVK